MKTKAALIASLTGAIFVALCCFTPALIMLLSAVGLAGWACSFDSILFPALGVMEGLSVYFYWRYRRRCNCKH